MRDETVARSYAEALLALAQKHDGVAAFGEAIELVSRALDENPQFRLFLETPRVALRSKREVLRKAFGDRVPGMFLNFLLVTLDKRRQGLLRRIAREFRLLEDQELGRLHVELTLSREPEAGELDDLAERLSGLLGLQAIPHLRVRPEILGGVIFRAGDTIYDGSLRRKLQRMRRGLLGADLPSAADL